MAQPNKQNIMAGLFTAFAFEQLTVDNTVKILTESKYIDSNDNFRAVRVVITVESKQIRYTYDGTIPTTTIGHLLNPMDVLVLIGSANIINFKVTRATDTSGKISITYEK